jgi:hypothetical protein
MAVLPANAQSRWADAPVSPSTAAPPALRSTASSAPVVANHFTLNEGVTYGMHNRPGSTDDCYGSFNPEEPFDASCTESYATSAFAGTIGGDDLFYYVLQTDTTTAVDSLYAYDFDAASEAGSRRPIAYVDADGAPIALADVPQWVDGGIDTETGELVLLGRAAGGSGAYGCTEEQGATLFTLDLATAVARPLLQFADPDNCPLSGAYDNELGFFVGMVPGDGGATRIVQTDLADGAVLGSFIIPCDFTQCQIAAFIQAGATDFRLNDDPSDNTHWLFLFQGVNPDLVSTAQLVTFDAEGVVNGLLNFGEIDDEFEWVEVLATGFSIRRPLSDAAEPDVSSSAFTSFGVYPNPARAAATVMLRADAPAEHVTVKAYDVLGRQVALVHDGPLTASTHQFGLEARTLPAGVYFVTVRSGDFVQTQRVLLTN